jgi:hypothetical protein
MKERAAKEKRKRTMRRFHFSQCGHRALLRVIHRSIHALKALPGTVAGALRRPANQYRLALLLAMLLAILLGVSIFPHTPVVAFTGHL